LSNFNFVKFRYNFVDNHRRYGYKIRHKCVWVFFRVVCPIILTDC